MRAVLSDFGIIDSRNDMLTISMIMGTNSALHSFRSQVGKGSAMLCYPALKKALKSFASFLLQV